MDVFDAMETCRAILLLKPDPVPVELIDNCRGRASRAPIPGNSQGWDFVVVDDPAPKATIASAIRSNVGAGFPVGVRLSGTDFIQGGIDPAEATAIARHIEPFVDFLDISMGSYWQFHKFLSTLDNPLGYELESSEQVARSVRVPTIVTGRIMTLDHASHLVETGVADMVSLVRAMVADPHLVKKSREGREAEIRPCIGTSMGCVAQLMTTGRLQCVVNVAAGRETSVAFETPSPAETRKKILVIAGGPAGLEAARTAALRGHEVHLYEMTANLVGQVRMAASAPHRADLAALTGFLADEIKRLGVHVHLRTPVDPDLVIGERPDEVVVRGIGNDLVRTFASDTVVIATYHEPNAELAGYLRAAGLRVHLAGNVNGSDNIQAAVHGASAIARAL
jgi:NADH:flavin oxidoreductase / NADH oxidase family/Nitroreductase family